MTLQIRFLQKQGADLTTAVAAGGLLSNAAWFVVQIAMFCMALGLSPDSANFGNISAAAVVEFLRSWSSSWELPRSSSWPSGDSDERPCHRSGVAAQ